MHDHRAQEEYALPDKICNETIGRLVIEIIGRIPLLDFAMMHDADFICDGKSLVLIVGHQYSRCVLALENVAYFQAQTLTQASTSRFEKGSSSNNKSGRGANARANATRCCWPPESS